MDLNQVRSFIAVARHGHLTRASESLHLSQPALSAQIRSLEESLGVTLFRRTPSGMILTPSGQVLLDQAERVMAAVQEFRTRADSLQGVLTGHLRIGTVLDAATLRVGELLNRAMERHPQIELELHHLVSHEALAKLRDGSLDASFYFGAMPDNLEAVALRDLTYRVAIPITWEQEIDVSDWNALAQRPWVVAPATSSHRQLVLEAFSARAMPPPEHTIEADSESLIVNLVESGVGASVVREELALGSASEKRIAVLQEPRVMTTLWLAFDRPKTTDPLVAAFVESVREVWEQPVALAA